MSVEKVGECIKHFVRVSSYRGNLSLDLLYPRRDLTLGQAIELSSSLGFALAQANHGELIISHHSVDRFHEMFRAMYIAAAARKSVVMSDSLAIAFPDGEVDGVIITRIVSRADGGTFNHHIVPRVFNPRNMMPNTMALACVHKGLAA